MKTLSVPFLALLLIVTAGGCSGSAATDSESDPGAGSIDPPATLALATQTVAGLFSGMEVESALVKRGVAASDADICNGLVNQPDGVESRLYGAAGTYGAASRSAAVTEPDFCELEDGTANSGTGPDGEGLFASFRVALATSSCTDGNSGTTRVYIRSGEGIFRNTDDDFPQIYGHFTLAGEDIDCTIFLDENSSATVAECTDSDGETVTASGIDMDCSLSAEIIAPDFEGSVYKGIWAPTLLSGATPSMADPNALLEDGVNFMSIMVPATVDATGAVIPGVDEEEIGNTILDYYDYGLNVLLSLDSTYSADGTGGNAEDPAVPDSVITGTDYLTNLSTEVIDLAQIAEDYDVLILAPYNEADLKMGASTAYTWGQTVLAEIDDQTDYDGHLLWKAGRTLDATTNTSGYDMVGLSITRAPGATDESFREEAEESVSGLLANKSTYSIPETMISEFGAWGSGDTGLSEQQIADVFDTVFDTAEDYVDGFNAFDGPAPDEPGLRDSLAEDVVSGWYLSH